MEDGQIIELYWRRSEQAIQATAEKYGGYCYSIAYSVLGNRQDSEECVNDVYLSLWRAIPPQRPQRLSAFAGKIARNLALHRWEKSRAQKRGQGQVPLALEELEQCLPAPGRPEQIVEEMALAQALNRFLASLSLEKRKLFIGRYWYLRSIREIAAAYGLSESKVKLSLFRCRKALKKFLQEEGIDL